MCQSKNGGAGRVRTSQPNPSASRPSPQSSCYVTKGRLKPPRLQVCAGGWSALSHPDSLQGISPGLPTCLLCPFSRGPEYFSSCLSSSGAPSPATSAPLPLRSSDRTILPVSPSFLLVPATLQTWRVGTGVEQNNKKQQTDPSGGNRRVVVKVATAHLFSQK